MRSLISYAYRIANDKTSSSRMRAKTKKKAKRIRNHFALAHKYTHPFRNTNPIAEKLRQTLFCCCELARSHYESKTQCEPTHFVRRSTTTEQCFRCCLYFLLLASCALWPPPTKFHNHLIIIIISAAAVLIRRTVCPCVCVCQPASARVKLSSLVSLTIALRLRECVLRAVKHTHTHNAGCERVCVWESVCLCIGVRVCTLNESVLVNTRGHQ